MEWEKQLEEVKRYYSENTIILSDYMYDKETYRDYVETVYGHVKLGFEVKDYREQIVGFKFRKGGDTIGIQLRHYIINLLMWNMFVDLGVTDDLDESFLVQTDKISSKYIKSYIDNKCIIPYRRKTSNEKMNKVLARTLFELTRISMDFNIILGMTMNIEGFIELANSSERFNEIIRTKLDDNLQPQEVENIIDGLMKEELEILANSDTIFSPMIKSGTGIKSKQLAELSISGGLKPDLQDQTIPIPINTNLLVGGLNSVASYYIDALGGRKAMILNKTEMGKSGHFARKMMLLGSISDLDRSDNGCNTITPIKIFMESKEWLRMFEGRYYKLPHWTHYKVLTLSDADLVGQTIYVKSPLTCTSKHGICRECYGETLYWINKDVHVGLLAGATTTNPISQRILSSKHILTTNSNPVKFNEDFYRFFELRSNEIYVNTDIDAIRDWEIVILSNNVIQTETLSDGDISDFVNLFHVRNVKTGEILEINEQNMDDIFLDPEFCKDIGLNGKKSAERTMKLASIDDNMRIAVMPVYNNGLTKPLYDMMNLLNSSKRRKSMEIETVHDMVQKMAELIIESGIDTVSVHPEVLMRQLVRDKDFELERPNFRTIAGSKSYNLITLDSALTNHKSPILGLSFQYLKRQLTSPLTFKKNGDSILDEMFKVRR